MPKYYCSFCGKTNTTITGIYKTQGIIFTEQVKIGEKEVLTSEKFYRCVDCGTIYCSTHYLSLCRHSKLEKTFFKNKRIEYDICPKCNSDIIKQL